MPPAPCINVSELHAKLKQPCCGLKPIAAPPLLIDKLCKAITKRKACCCVCGGITHHCKHINHTWHVNNLMFSFLGAAQQVQAGSGHFQFTETAASALAPAAPAPAAPAAPALAAELLLSAVCLRLAVLEFKLLDTTLLQSPPNASL